MLDETKAENSVLVQESAAIEPALLDELVKAGVLYGRKKSKTHPRMQQYIYTTRNEMEIIDVIQTLSMADRAADFLKAVVAKGGVLLVVGTTPPAKELVKAFSTRFGYPCVTERWLGGTLTNFKTLNARLQHYIKLKADRDGGKLEKYTKKERIQFDKEIERLSALFGGMESLSRLPDALLVVNATAHLTAIREAKRMKIPVVSIMGTDADPDLVNYLIPANDRAKSSIAWFLERLAKGVEEGKKEAIRMASAVEVKGNDKQ